MKGYFAGSIIEADLKLIEDPSASEKIEANSKALRETDRSSNLRSPDLDWEVMDESWNKASVANHDHLRSTVLPVYPHVSGLRSIDNGESSPRIDEDPDFMILERNGDDRHQVAFVKGVWKLDKRHTISSSLGTLSTEGTL